MLEQLPKAERLKALFRGLGRVGIHRGHGGVSGRLAGCNQRYGASGMQMCSIQRSK
jgi:hypothetical protein